MNGSVECWGRNDFGQATLPSGKFSFVNAGPSHTCGVKQDGSVVCWGGFNRYGETTPPAGAFASVSAGALFFDGHTCGVKRDNSLECWGNNDYGQSTPPPGEFIAVSAGVGYTCGVKVNGSVECWGFDESGQATPPPGEFATVSAGERHTCGVKVDGSVECWGSDEYGQATPPPGEFAVVSAEGGHTCGVKLDESVECWGGNGIEDFTPPAGEFVSASAGISHTCAIKRDGSVICWGSDSDGQEMPPTGAFVSVSAGWLHTCGLRMDGSVECWDWYKGPGIFMPATLEESETVARPPDTPTPSSTEAPTDAPMSTPTPTHTPTPPPTSEPSPTPEPKPVGVSPSDRAALIAFYKETGGSGWTWGSGCSKWAVSDGNADVGQWCGVTVEDGRVTRLELPGYNLRGAIPDVVGNLGKLTHLNLSGNSLDGEVPPALLSALTGLTYLDLSGNDLDGALPPDLDRLANLTHLNLSGNEFRGHISRENPDRPIVWRNLSQLTHLDLSWNKRCGSFGCRHGLSGWIPSPFTHADHDWFPNLAYLDLSGNELQGGAQALLEKSHAVSAGEERLITVNLSDNPWDYEPEENRGYWNEFHGELLWGFVDLAKLSAQQKYGIPSLDPGSLGIYAAGKDLELIEVRAVKHLAESGKYAKSATWIIRGAKIVGTAGTGVGWVVFTLETANILNQMLEYGVDFLEAGPGAMIERTSNRFLGQWWSCALSNGLENAPVEEINAVCGEW